MGIISDIRGVRVNWQKDPRITAWLSLAGTSGKSPCHTGVTQSCLSKAICQTLSGVSVSPSHRGVQNWTWHFRSGLTSAQESGRVPLVMQPRMLVAFFAGFWELVVIQSHRFCLQSCFQSVSSQPVLAPGVPLPQVKEGF